MSGITQDWEDVVIRKKAPTAADRKDEKAVNAARRAGAEIETVKKSTAGTNKAASSSTSLNTRKLAEDTENLSHQKVPTKLKKAIIQARQDKKYTQAAGRAVRAQIAAAAKKPADTNIKEKQFSSGNWDDASSSTNLKCFLSDSWPASKIIYSSSSCISLW